MAMYCFRGIYCRQYGEVREYPGSMKDPPMAVFDPETGFYGVRDIAAEHGGSSLFGPGAGWPMHCEASGVHPAQVDEARAQSVKDGCPTDFDRFGRAILRDRKHRAAYLKSRGIFDRGAGYSDPAP